MMTGISKANTHQRCSFFASPEKPGIYAPAHKFTFSREILLLGKEIFPTQNQRV